MASQFKHLFTPLKIGSFTVRNRILSTAHATAYVTDGLPDEREMYYQAEKAKGGAGLCIMGATSVDPSSPLMYGMPANRDDRIVPAYQRIADMVHQHSGRIMAQMTHIGRICSSPVATRALVAPSAVPDQMHRLVPHEIEEEEIARIVQAFGSAAGRVRKGGLDGVLIQGSHGYFLCSFLSPLTNRRTDRYGGSVENRMRIVIEVLEAARRQVGTDFTLGIRISADEFLDGGLTLDDTRVIASILSESKLIDFLDVSAGNDGSYMAMALHYPPMYVPLANLVHLAAAIKEVVDIPVFTVGRITDPLIAERVLADGHADMVGMTRAIIADPEMPRKAMGGQLDDIRQCLGVNEGCLGRVNRGLPITCVQNPAIGREKVLSEIKPARVSKNVVVVGGGPAGLEAARVGALRGHKVTLFEKAQELGGQVLVAAKAPNRSEFEGATRWLAGQVRKLAVTVRLGVEATPGEIIGLAPDAVIVATGSRPRMPDVPGIDSIQAISANDVLAGRVETGKKVLVLDGEGHLSGLSTADFISEQGKDVEIAGTSYHIGDEVDENNRALLYARVLSKGVKMRPLTWIRSVDGSSVTLHNVLTEQEEVVEGIDTLVFAGSRQAEDALYHALKGKVPELRLIGDALAPRRLDSAIREGTEVAREL